jgi:hypothetical protein
MNTRRNLILAVIASVMLFAVAFAAFPAKAEGNTWDVSVYHGINGRSLGLSKELPVNVTIYKDGAPIAFLNDFTFGERVNATLPAGEYKVEVFSQELGVIVPSMTLGPVEIPAGADLVIRAVLGAGKTPRLMVK